MKESHLYRVKEIFLTIQGEGYHAGSLAVFVRLAGCNVWSGLEEHRTRDTARGCCAAWCDTDFRGGEVLSAAEIADRVGGLWPREVSGAPPTVVLTGGEPTLQLREDLVQAIHALGGRLHVETNGSGALPQGVDWATLSPKPPMRVLARGFGKLYDEVKVVFPAVDPGPWAHHGHRLFVQPQDGNPVGVRACIAFVREDPRWRLSIQTHKILGIP